MLALARTDETLEDALRAALGSATAAATAARRGELTQRVRCVVCHGAAERERTIGGGYVTACDRCGSVLEEQPEPRSHLRLV
jgi:hypothetical protein